METGFFEKKYEKMLSLIDVNSNVLDLGCYDGRVADFLSNQLGCKVDGVDISDINISKENKIIKKYIFDLNDKKWPIDKKKKYDYVIFTDVIEHIYDVDQFMLNVKKYVKENGYIIFSTPNIASIGRRLLLLLGKNPYIEISKYDEINLFKAPIVGHVKYFTLGSMLSLAEFYNFKVTNVVPSSITGNLSINFIEKFFPSLCWHIFIKAQKD